MRRNVYYINKYYEIINFLTSLLNSVNIYEWKRVTHLSLKVLVLTIFTFIQCGLMKCLVTKQHCRSGNSGIKAFRISRITSALPEPAGRKSFQMELR